ncbi:hypothetical protein BN000_00261 [Mycobacterium europaeum]|uniref:Uncharacterized protein n=1 Tax=Mycobacterium europaeum TaxID=761804 RepID=A0A0U1CXT0_9MYCO|nr:hypothetical protein [Mycobacterium europaeum]ORV62250.1 hypothetical protein AWC03_07620 [Mycobacterium europaeum]CQD02488.1 hypothetical protein BN000_00261 [Mycobacterium europaeum]
MAGALIGSEAIAGGSLTRGQYVKDIRRAEIVGSLGWTVIRVINEDRPSAIVQRAREALARRSSPRLP